MGLGQEEQEGNYIYIGLSLPNAHPKGVPLPPLFHIKKDVEDDVCPFSWGSEDTIQVVAEPHKAEQAHPDGAGSPTAHDSSGPLPILSHTSSQPLPGRDPADQDSSSPPPGTAMPSTACSNLPASEQSSAGGKVQKKYSLYKNEK